MKIFLVAFAISVALSARWTVLASATSANVRGIVFTRLIALQSNHHCEAVGKLQGHPLCGPQIVPGGMASDLFISAEQLYNGRIVGPSHQKYVVLQQSLPEHRGRGDVPNSYVTLMVAAEVSTEVELATGLYQLQVHAKHATPGPVLLRVFVGSRLLGTVEFGNNDDTWETKCLLFHHDRRANPMQQIRVRFANDGGENGSRDAGLAWLRLVPVSQPRLF